MTLRSVILGSSFAVAATIAVVMGQQPPPQPPPTEPPQQPSSVAIRISGEAGALPHYAVPDFLALSNDRETQEAARTIADVLWHDLQYEREFDMIARDIYKSIPPPASIGDPPYDRWREVGADGLILGSVQKVGNEVRVAMRLYSVPARQQAYAREYTGAIANPRLFAHTIADEVHQTQAQLRGIARTKLTFTSDRNRERVTGTVENRDVKEVYVADYDGFNQRRITVGRQLNATPVWAPDGRAIAYTSWRSGFMDIYISNIFQGTMSTPAKGTPNSQNFLPAFSPDGTRLAFSSNRDGNSEIYVMNRDGSDLRRITNHPSIDSTPTWSPTGAQIAFTSERGGSPGIYVVGIDGLGLRRISSDTYADRATWSPAPLNEIAYAARTGPGYDIKVLNIASGQTRQITFGEGSNESPAWAPNGRHMAFTSTRAGRTQVFTVDLDGKNVRQMTRDGNNFYPNWSQ
jgi:TolB protein